MGTLLCKVSQILYYWKLLVKFSYFQGADFEYVEQDPYDKTPEWLAVNPKGEAPAIVHHGKSVYESLVCLEYIGEFLCSFRNFIVRVVMLEAIGSLHFKDILE